MLFMEISSIFRAPFGAMNVGLCRHQNVPIVVFCKVVKPTPQRVTVGGVCGLQNSTVCAFHQAWNISTDHMSSE